MRCSYSKEEGLELPAIALKGFDYVISEHPPAQLASHNYQAVAAVQAFDGVRPLPPPH